MASSGGKRPPANKLNNKRMSALARAYEFPKENISASGETIDV